MSVDDEFFPLSFESCPPTEGSPHDGAGFDEFLNESRMGSLSPAKYALEGEEAKNDIEGPGWNSSEDEQSECEQDEEELPSSSECEQDEEELLSSSEQSEEDEQEADEEYEFETTVSAKTANNFGGVTGSKPLQDQKNKEVFNDVLRGGRYMTLLVEAKGDAANLLPRTKEDLAKVLSVEATTNDNKLEGRTTFAKYNAFHCFEFSETNGKIQFSVAFSKDIIGEENGYLNQADSRQGEKGLKFVVKLRDQVIYTSSYLVIVDKRTSKAKAMKSASAQSSPSAQSTRRRGLQPRAATAPPRKKRKKVKSDQSRTTRSRSNAPPPDSDCQSEIPLSMPTEPDAPPHPSMLPPSLSSCTPVRASQKDIIRPEPRRSRDGLPSTPQNGFISSAIGRRSPAAVLQREQDKENRYPFDASPFKHPWMMNTPMSYLPSRVTTPMFHSASSAFQFAPPTCEKPKPVLGLAQRSGRSQRDKTARVASLQ